LVLVLQSLFEIYIGIGNTFFKLYWYWYCQYYLKVLLTTLASGFGYSRPRGSIQHINTPTCICLPNWGWPYQNFGTWLVLQKTRTMGLSGSERISTI